MLRRVGQVLLPAGKPALTAADISKLDVSGRLQAGAAHWSVRGFGTPGLVFGIYAIKMAAFVAGWWASVQRSDEAAPGLMGMGKDAFLRLIIFSQLFEVAGLGCAFGPLMGKFIWPSTNLLHFLRPGTIKVPWRWDLRDGTTPVLPFLSARRNALDVALFVALLVALALPLVATRVQPGVHFPPIIALLAWFGFSDSLVFLSARSEHYLWMLVCVYMEPGHGLVGASAVLVALWMWASVSKWGPWFPYVVQVMMSNGLLLRSRFLDPVKRLLYIDAASNDFRPSLAVQALSHFGSALELIFPLLLALGGGGVFTWVGCALALAFHLNILTQFALAAPQEWNVVCAISALYLFGPSQLGGLRAAAGSLSLDSLAALPASELAFLFVVEVLVPLVGNVWPKRVSFLVSHRYYAGNWAGSVWMVRKTAKPKLRKLVKANDFLADQLSSFYDEDVVANFEMRGMAARALHIHGRILPKALAKALSLAGGKADMNDFEVIEGEFAAGYCLGWSFGDGYLHSAYVMEAIQERCGFAPGELMHISWDSIGFLDRGQQAYEIRDLSKPWSEPLVKSSVPMHILRNLQPY